MSRVDFFSRFQVLECGEPIVAEIHERAGSKIAGRLAHAPLIVCQRHEPLFCEPTRRREVPSLASRAVKQKYSWERPTLVGKNQRPCQAQLAAWELDRFFLRC